MILLYHHTINKDILYFDATGSLTLPVKGFKRILLYSFCIRHPYGLTPALPVAQYLTRSHNVTSIRQFIIPVQKKDKECFNGIAENPRLVMMDYSFALILATIREFYHESLTQYLNRTYEIVSGKASFEDSKRKLIHICFSDIMKRNKTVLSRLEIEKSSIKEFYMQWFARVTECRFLS